MSSPTQTEDERNNLIDRYLSQQNRLKSMRATVATESKKLKVIEVDLKNILLLVPSHKIQILLNNNNGSEENSQATLVLKNVKKSEYLSRKSLGTLLLKYFTEKFQTDQTPVAISQFSQEATDFVWSSRNTVEQKSVHVVAQKNKRKRSPELN
jgi:hypothetical protein